MTEALRRLGAVVDSVDFDDPRWPALDRMMRCDGVLVWADPLTEAGDRAVLDTVLRDVSESGVWVSAHPNVIDKIGTKEVLFSTRPLGWGTDTHLYSTAAQFRSEFPRRLIADGTRVIKTSRGNGGRGVWKVRLLSPAQGSNLPMDTPVAVQHARVRDDSFVVVPLDEFMTGTEAHFADWGGTTRLVDQAFSATITRGIVRCYLVGDRVAGFARQRPEAGTADTIMGLPSPKTMYRHDAPEFEGLRARVEQEWVPAMCDLVHLEPDALPVLWDADFLYGDAAPDADRWVLCEINASSVIPYPPSCPDLVAQRALATITPGGLS
jgi:hypothetical protein